MSKHVVTYWTNAKCFFSYHLHQDLESIIKQVVMTGKEK
jgi:hypothetical protein